MFGPSRLTGVEGIPILAYPEQLRGFFRETEAGQQVWDGLLAKTGTQFIAYNPTGPYMAFTSKPPLDSMKAYGSLKARYVAGVEHPRWEALDSNAISLPRKKSIPRCRTE